MCNVTKENHISYKDSEYNRFTLLNHAEMQMFYTHLMTILYRSWGFWNIRAAEIHSATP